jgi:hypothetical protein
MCVDETMMQWLMATLAGKKPNIDKVGRSYMLMGEARQGQGASPAKDPAQVKEWFYVGPHVMIVLPDTAQDAPKAAVAIRVESPGGVSPPGAPRTVHEPLDSHGSRCSAVAMT